MRTLQLSISLTILSIGQVFATSENPATRSVAMFFAALIFFGVVALIRGIKGKGKKE